MLREWYLSDTSRDWGPGRSLSQIMAIHRLLQSPPAAESEAGRRGELIGSWVFASMDRVVHLRPGWGLGIAMHSSRIFNFESINNENLRGWHTADGATYLYNSDLTQFSDNFWPTVDPQRLPGTTVIAGSTARQSQPGGSSVAGGATLDGFTAAMLRLQPDGRVLEANKSWFLFDDEIVALGSAIRATAGDRPVETVVENRLIRGTPEFTRSDDGAWAHLAGSEIGYFFPEERAWQALREDRTGSWSLLAATGSAAPISRRYQTIWFDHGVQPGNAGYAYALLPGFSAAQTADYSASPQFRVLENTAAVHAVVEDTLNLKAVNFWNAAEQTAAGVSSSGVASILIREWEGVVHIGIADPTQANADGLRIAIDRAAAEVLEADAAVAVEQMSPSIVLQVDTRGARGRTLRIRLRSAP
jgi:hyaluronate lyase